VLANVALLVIHHDTATEKLLCIVEDHPNWPLHADVFNDLHLLILSVDTHTQWKGLVITSSVTPLSSSLDLICCATSSDC